MLAKRACALSYDEYACCRPATAICFSIQCVVHADVHRKHLFFDGAISNELRRAHANHFPRPRPQVDIGVPDENGRLE
eukprot:4748505-Pleurochrysis_carterae.AAC.1